MQHRRESTARKGLANAYRHCCSGSRAAELKRKSSRYRRYGVVCNVNAKGKSRPWCGAPFSARWLRRWLRGLGRGMIVACSELANK